jgi:hypothetical protein
MRLSKRVAFRGADSLVRSLEGLRLKRTRLSALRKGEIVKAMVPPCDKNFNACRLSFIMEIEIIQGLRQLWSILGCRKSGLHSPEVYFLEGFRGPYNGINRASIEDGGIRRRQRAGEFAGFIIDLRI